MPYTEDQLDQIKEAYEHRDDVIGVIVTGLAFVTLVVIIAFGCYVLGDG